MLDSSGRPDAHAAAVQRSWHCPECKNAWPNLQPCLLACPADDEDLSVGQEELAHAQEVQREVSDALREALRGGNIILIPTMPGGPIRRT